jgi:hypothetical protein
LLVAKTLFRKIIHPHRNRLGVDLDGQKEKKDPFKHGQI